MSYAARRLLLLGSIRGLVERTFLISFGNVILFDQNRIFGYTFPTAGDFTLDVTGAVSGKTAKLIHSDLVPPVFTLPMGYTSNTSGVYIECINNEIYIRLSGTVFTIQIINE